MEQAEQPGSHYLSFVARLLRDGRRDVFERMPGEYRESTRDFHARLTACLPGAPEPLRAHRIARAMAFILHAAADRERARVKGLRVLPFAVHVNDTLDGLTGFLAAPVSPAAIAALDDIEPADRAWPMFLVTGPITGASHEREPE